MKYHSNLEIKTANRINELENLLFSEEADWEQATSELELIFSQIPTDYKNSFEDNGTLYIKFWDQEEFLNYVKVEEPKVNVDWIYNAYPRCCYVLSIIQIERGELDKAYQTLNKGLELEKDNPNLLNEMGLLLGKYAQISQEKKYLQQAIEYYREAFDSRSYNTASQKARSLRGVGFMLMDLNDLDNAEEYYKASLTWEESELAHDELKIIKKLKETEDINLHSAGSNLDKVEEINSYEYFEEQEKKLPKKLQDKIPNKYIYIWTKASNYYVMNPDEYRKEDYFHYPLEEWNLKQIQSGVVQIVDYIKGISTDHYIALDSIEDVENLLLTFHFLPIHKNILDSNVNHLLLEIEFQHKVDKDKITLYFQILVKSDKNLGEIFENIL